MSDKILTGQPALEQFLKDYGWDPVEERPDNWFCDRDRRGFICPRSE